MALQAVEKLLEIVQDTDNIKTSTQRDEKTSGTKQSLIVDQYHINRNEWYEFLSMTKGRRYISELLIYGYCNKDLCSINSILDIIVDFYNYDERMELKDFIQSRMDQYDLDRNLYDYVPFKNVDKLYDNNSKQIDKLSNKMVQKLLLLKEVIQNGIGENGECYNMDKESMVTFRTSGFCLNKEGGIIIFNER